MDINIKISCKNNDILKLLIDYSPKIAEHFGLEIDDLKLSHVTEYLNIFRNEEIVLTKA